MNKILTIVLPSYKSKKLILKHVKNISKKIQIIVIENSKDATLKTILDKKYKNVKTILKDNVGYGNAINLGSKLVKTKYFFVMNPDTTIYKNTLSLLLKSSKKIKNFGAISPNHINNRYRYKNKIIEQNTLTGGAMLFDTKIFRKLQGFDKNIFLYYEDNDYFTKCKKNNYKLFIISNSFHDHKKKSKGSAFFKNKDQKKYAHYLAGWHGQWSKFYFNKKYFGYIFALKKSLPNLIINIIQLFLNLFINPYKSKYIYFKIEGLIVSILGIASFKRSKYD
jgi:GT2 family glycosyltransferase|tara:strand:+ start:39 stop:875 length:837 start_codon:yes stop_codon:yes gene_type:complete